MGAAGPGLSARSPQSELLRAVRAELADLAPGDRVVVALSGGPDSLALVAATVPVAQELGLVCAARVVDHGLQPGSAAVAATAADQARLLGCDDAEVLTVRVDLGPGAGGPEAAARRARYDALARAAEPTDGPSAAAVLLGHTRDDQAETVLLALARGSGTRAVAGMAPRTGVYRRPLLDMPRSVVRAAASALEQADPRLASWADPHNSSERFARVRVRYGVLPALEAALGPAAVTGLVRTARLARQDADALDAWAALAWDELRAGGSVRVGPAPTNRPGPDPSAPGAGPRSARDAPALRATADVAALREGSGPLAGPRPSAIRTRLVRRLLVAAGCPPGALSSAHVHRVDALVTGPAGSRAEVALPGGLRARRVGAALRVRA